MNRWARFFRTAGGLCLLIELAVLFLPVLMISQENYPTIRYSQFDYIKELFQEDISDKRIILTVVLMILPAVLAVVTGVAKVVGSKRQLITGTGSVLICALYIALFFYLENIGPKRLNDAQVYEKAFGMWLLLGFSVVAVVFCVVEWILVLQSQKKYGKGKNPYVAVTERTKNTTSTTVSQKVEKVLAEKNDAVTQPMESSASLEAKGALVGLSGIYYGARIYLKDGEVLKVGRDVSNDLVFSNVQRISRFHCTLTWIAKEQKFQIVDTSRNGCFVNGMEKGIPKDTAIYLEPGTILDIGNEENRFRLE